MKRFEFSDIKLPIIQAPMAGGFNTPNLASAVANAGGVGSFGFSFTTPEKIDETLIVTKNLTKGFINANFFVFKPINLPDNSYQKNVIESLSKLSFEKDYQLEIPKEPFYPSLENQVEAALKNFPSFITFHLGIPPISIIDKVKSFGIPIGITATTLEDALLIEKSGADFLVLQGIEAGGHRGVFNQEEYDQELELNVLINQIISEIRIPFVAAGGIMDGKDIKRVLNMGAKAAQLGTAFLCCDEAGTTSIHKYYLLNKQNRKTKLTRSFSGRLARGIINKFIIEMEGKPILPFPAQNTFTTSIRKMSVKENNGEFVNLWAGTNFSKIRQMPAFQLMEKFKAEIN